MISSSSKKDTQAVYYHRLAIVEFAIRKDYDKAIQYYTLAIKKKRRPDALQCTLLSNRAHCYILQKKYKLAIDDSQAALKLDKTSLKAWYCLALSQFEYDDHDTKAAEYIHMAKRYATDDLSMKCISELAAKVNQRLMDNKTAKYKHRRPDKVSVDYFGKRKPISLLSVVEIFNRHLHRLYHEKNSHNFRIEVIRIKGNDWFTRWHKKEVRQICSVPGYSQSRRNNVHWKVRCSNNCTTFNLTLALALQDLLIDYKIPMLYDGALVTSIGVVQGFFMTSKIKNPVLHFENGDISKILNIAGHSKHKGNFSHNAVIAVLNKEVFDEKRKIMTQRHVYIDLSGPQIDLYNYDSNGFPAFCCHATPYEIDLPDFTPDIMKGEKAYYYGETFDKVSIFYDVNDFFNTSFDTNMPKLKKTMVKVIEETIKEVQSSKSK